MTASPDNWQARGNCVGVGPDLFFPERGEATEEAKAVCAGCTVRDQCLAYALDTRQEHGVWGGLSGQERLALRRERHLARQPAKAAATREAS